MLDNITPIKSDREALKEIQTIIAAKSEAVKRHQVRAVQGAGKRPRQCCHPKGPRTKGTATRGPEGPESGRNMRVRGPEGPEDELS